jgi:hypothetical protein
MLIPCGYIDARWVRLILATRWKVDYSLLCSQKWLNMRPDRMHCFNNSTTAQCAISSASLLEEWKNSSSSDVGPIDKHSRDRQLFFSSINICSVWTTITTSLSPIMSDEIVWQVINQQFCSYKLKWVLFWEPSPFARSALINCIGRDRKSGTAANDRLFFSTGRRKTKISVAMNTTSAVSATANPVR